MAHKVFVDLDEEITLAVEKVLKAEGNQIILVVPESAQLVSSLVSLKLLSRQIYKKNKMIVLVTEDKVGQQLSRKAGLVSVEKVSDVNGDVWKKALQLREDFKKGREKTKKMLVDKREEGEEVEFEEEAGDEGGGAESEVKAEDYFQGMPEKPRLEGKLVSIGGFPIYAGGDIKEDINVLKEVTTKERELNEAKKLERMSVPLSSVDDEGDKKKGAAVMPEPEKAQAEEISKGGSSKTTSFVGRDLTKATVGVEPIRRRIGPALGGMGAVGGGIIEKIKAFYSGESGKKRIYYTAGGAILLIVFLLGYFVFPEVTFNITLAEANVPVNESVKASLAQSTVDVATQTIPARKVEVKKSTSKKAQSTGQGETGDKAQGVATFNNQTPSPIPLAAGTILTALNDASLKFSLIAAITVPAKPCADPCATPGQIEGNIIAASHGEKYNGTSIRTYSITGHNVANLSATSLSNQVQGGTTEDVTEISQADFDDLRNALTEELQGAMLSELDALVSDNEVKLDGTQKFSEPKATSKNKVGDDVEEFEMTVELTGTMLVATENDLKDLANQLIEQKDKLEGTFEIEDVSELEVGMANLSGDVATFNLRLSGSIRASIDEQAVKDAVRGKSYLDAVRIIKEMDDVESVEVDYSPAWMPIKRIPDDDAKITVIFK